MLIKSVKIRVNLWLKRKEAISCYETAPFK